MQDTPTRPKILHLVNQSRFGGTQRYILNLAQHQSQQGYEIVVGAGEATDESFVQALQTVSNAFFFHLPHVSSHINPLNDLLSLFELRRLIRRVRPSIIHIHSPKLNLLAGLAARRLRATRYASRVAIPIIYTIHGFWLNEQVNVFKHLLHYILEWCGMRMMSSVISVCVQDLADARQTEVLPLSIPSQAIPNALNPATVGFAEPPQAKNELERLSNTSFGSKKIIGVVSSLYPSKGIEVFLDALHTLSPKDVASVIIGNGPLKNNLTLRVTRYALRDSVFLLGHLPNASQYLQALDLLVLPSIKEGLATVLLEANAAGIPVVATKVGGNSEVKQSNWIMIPPKDAAALAKAIEIGLTLPRAKPKTQEQLQREYDEFLRKTDEVYNKLLSDL